MAAGIEEYMNPALVVAAQDDGLVTHTGDEKIARFGNLAVVADEQPGAGEEFLQFLAVNIRRGEDVAIDGARGEIDHARRSAASRATRSLRMTFMSRTPGLNH
jgi:hypothetical protein